MSSDNKLSHPDAGALAYVNAWNRAKPELEHERLRALRQLTEEQSAQLFARLISPSGSYPLRESSGLVEQQRIFARLRDQAS